MPAAFRATELCPSAAITSRAVKRRPVIKRRAYDIRVEDIIRDHRFVPRDVRRFVGDPRQRGDKIVVSNVFAECVEPDVGRFENSGGRREYGTRVVDDPERSDRGRSCGDGVAQAKHLERAKRSFEQRDRTTVERRRGLADERHAPAGACKSNGREQASRAGAGHENVAGGSRHVRHAPGNVGLSMLTAPDATFCNASG